jgi:hypothetical protein
MYGRLQIHRPHRGWIRWVSDGDQKGFNWESKGDQTVLLFRTLQPVSAELIHGVFVPITSGAIDGLYSHISPGHTGFPIRRLSR